MTGAQIITAILADSFDASRTTEALAWANAALGEVWNAEEWTFRQTSEPVKVTAGSQTVTEISSSYGIALEPIDEYRDFAARYVGTANTTPGLPEAFCAVDTGIYVGPTSSETSTDYLLVYEKKIPLLANDSTEAAIPSEAHLALVFGGKARGYRLTNVDRAAAMDAELARTVDQLRRSYLRAARGTATQAPAYRPGC